MSAGVSTPLADGEQALDVEEMAVHEVGRARRHRPSASAATSASCSASK